MSNVGGIHKQYTGNEDAADVKHGKSSKRKCMGVIKCMNLDCHFTTRPQTKSKGIKLQLIDHCRICSYQQEHITCDATIRIVRYQAGVQFEHYGTHNHARPPRILHLSVEEESKFEEVVKMNPRAGPLPLITGAPGAAGGGVSVADISPALINADRVKYEKRKLKFSGISGGDHFFQQFQEFQRQYPAFQLHTTMAGEVVVISGHTQFTIEAAVKELIPTENINGLVTDAAMKFYLEENTILINTATYNSIMRCWVPVLSSYSNGQTSVHYEQH